MKRWREGFATKPRLALVAFCSAVVLAGAVTPAYAAEGGNADAAHACQQGGWEQWRQADQTPFTSVGECVSYAAQGGTLSAPKPAAQVLCESFGGTYAPGTGNTFWSCTYNANNAAFAALAEQCFQDVRAVYPNASIGFGFVSGDPFGVRTDACTVTAF